MGIKGLSKAIRRMAPAAVRETQLADYAGRTLAIDACIFMYKFRYIGRPIVLFTDTATPNPAPPRPARPASTPRARALRTAHASSQSLRRRARGRPNGFPCSL